MATHSYKPFLVTAIIVVFLAMLSVVLYWAVVVGMRRQVYQDLRRKGATVMVVDSHLTQKIVEDILHFQPNPEVAGKQNHGLPDSIPLTAPAVLRVTVPGYADEYPQEELASFPMREVTSLALHGMEIDRELIESLGVKPVCRELTLNSFGILGEGEFRAIAENFPNLKRFLLLGTNIDAGNLDLLEGLPLTVLDLDTTGMIVLSEGDTEKLVRAFPNLTKLRIRGIEKEATNVLGSLRHLETLSLVWPKRSDGAGLELAVFPGLTQLTIRQYVGGKLGGSDFSPFEGPEMPGLETLRVHSSELTREDVRDLVRRCPSITKLSLNRTLVNGSALAELSSLPNLRTLDLTGMKLNLADPSLVLSFDGVEVLADRATMLRLSFSEKTRLEVMKQSDEYRVYDNDFDVMDLQIVP